MAQLDRLIEILFRHGADALHLARERKAWLAVGTSERAVVKTPMAGAQIRALVAEIAPDAGRRALAADESATFEYACQAGKVVVEVAPGPRIAIRPFPVTTSEPPVPPVRAPAPAVEARAAGVVPAAGVDGGAPAIERLFCVLLDRGGSDLHLSSGARPMIRIDGDLCEIEAEPVLTPEAAERLLLEIAPPRNRDEFLERGDTDFAHALGDRARLRCNLFQDRKGPGGVFRVIPNEIFSADHLGLSPQIRELAQLSKGLVLVTGPTGSGKSTTLATLVDLINRSRSDHIITIEDPIEFVHHNRRCLVNQREVHLHTRGFKAALRAALREDPDVVLVGEMRDLETIAIALETAETGHLVFGTLHTNSAVSTIDRLVDQFPADRQNQIRIMLSESLEAVIAQTLCKRIGGGRVAALEVLMVNAAVSNLIREGKTFQIQSIMQTGKKLGMVTLNDALLDLVRRKLVEPAEGYRKAIDKHALVGGLRKLGARVDFIESGEPAGVAGP